jgi:Iron-sulfur cluster assembly accessory protein
MASDTIDTPAIRMRISDNAARRIAALTATDDAAGAMLRIAVSGGGCSGFQYGFSLDDRQHDDDLVFEHQGSRVVVDEVSIGLLNGAELDYVEDLIGSYFAVKNPNATSTCGCGSSFSI